MNDGTGLIRRIELIAAARGSQKANWLQARTAVIPGEKPVIVTTMSEYPQDLKGSHAYHDIHETRSYNMGRTWSEPEVIPTLRKREIEGGCEKVIGDFWPKWHDSTCTILGTGKSFFFKAGIFGSESGRYDVESMQEVAYCVCDEKKGGWGPMKSVEMPTVDNAGEPLKETNAGCTQRYDLPDGEILLPFRYVRRQSARYVSAVARCSYDGQTLSYIEHGSEFTIDSGRGLCEPSATKYGEEYFLTMRANHSGFVTKGTDGINFQPMKEWTFDDGTPLGSYNTQQHWVAHSEGLFLVYTRRGVDNDHIFRHRAPLLISQVDEERLCVIRESEKILLPENNATFGNGGVVHVNENETWITDAEGLQNERAGEDNKVLIGRIVWNKPNALKTDSE